MRLMQELDILQESAKQYQMEVMRLGQRASEISQYDKGAVLEKQIRKEEKQLQGLTSEFVKM